MTIDPLSAQPISTRQGGRKRRSVGIIAVNISPEYRSDEECLNCYPQITQIPADFLLGISRLRFGFAATLDTLEDPGLDGFVFSGFGY